MGPTGQVGRPGRSVGLPEAPSASSFVQQAVLGLLILTPLVLACLEWSELVLRLHLVHLSLNRRSDIFCDFMSGQSVLVTCILAQKHNLHFLEGEVWFRDFIG